MRVLVLISFCLVAVQCNSSRIPRDLLEPVYGAPPIQTRPIQVESDDGYHYPKPNIQTRPIFKDPEPITELPIVPIQTRPLFNTNNVNTLPVTTISNPVPNYVQTRPIYNPPQNSFVQTRPIVYQPQPNVIETRPIYAPPQQTILQTRPIIYTEPAPNYIQTRPIYNPPQVTFVETRPIYYEPAKPIYNPPQNNLIQTRPIYNPPPPSYIQTRPIYNQVKSNPIADAVEVVASISNKASEKFLQPFFNAISGGFPNNNYPQYPGTNNIGFPGGSGNYPGNYPNYPNNPSYPNYPNYPNNNPILNKFPFLAGLFPNNNNNNNYNGYNYQRYAAPPTIVPIPAATNGGDFGQIDISIHGVNSLGDGISVNEIPSVEPQGYDYPNPNDQKLPHELPSGLQFRTLDSQDDFTQ